MDSTPQNTEGSEDDEGGGGGGGGGRGLDADDDKHQDNRSEEEDEEAEAVETSRHNLKKKRRCITDPAFAKRILEKVALFRKLRGQIIQLEVALDLLRCVCVKWTNI